MVSIWYQFNIFSISPKSKSHFLFFFWDLVGVEGIVGQGDLDLGLTIFFNKKTKKPSWITISISFPRVFVGRFHGR